MKSTHVSRYLAAFLMLLGSQMVSAGIMYVEDMRGIETTATIYSTFSSHSESDSDSDAPVTPFSDFGPSSIYSSVTTGGSGDTVYYTGEASASQTSVLTSSQIQAMGTAGSKADTVVNTSGSVSPRVDNAEGSAQSNLLIAFGVTEAQTFDLDLTLSSDGGGAGFTLGVYDSVNDLFVSTFVDLATSSGDAGSHMLQGLLDPSILGTDQYFAVSTGASAQSFSNGLPPSAMASAGFDFALALLPVPAPPTILLVASGLVLLLGRKVVR